ncbi:aldose 1-epimerase [Morganella morganii]
MTRLLECTLGDTSIAVAPELGGALAWLRWKGHDILRPLSLAGEQRANLCGSYPLLPWSNRIANGHFFFRGTGHRLMRNFGDHPHPLHGNAWQSVWQPLRITENEIVLTLTHHAGESWPWPYRAEQRFLLSSNTLRMEISYYNTAQESVPVGLGFHPFFADAAGSEISFTAEKVWLNGEDSLPTTQEQIPEEWRYALFRSPEPGSVDNCFTGWQSPACVRWPSRQIRVAVHSAVSNAILFIPSAERNVVAIEPVTHINNAINILPADSSPQAMSAINPGESLTHWMELRMTNDE